MHNSLSLRFEKASSFEQPKAKHWIAFAVAVALFLNLLNYYYICMRTEKAQRKRAYPFILSSLVV